MPTTLRRSAPATVIAGLALLATALWPAGGPPRALAMLDDTSGPGAGALARVAPLDPFVPALPVSPSGPTSALFRGAARAYGADAPAGTTVAAWLGNTPVVTSTVFLSSTSHVYELLVPGDDPATGAKEGPAEGEALRFRLGGVTTNEGDIFHNGETRVLDLNASRLEICLSAYRDLDRDGVPDPGEPLIPGVDINVLQFMVMRRYTTSGDAADEPSCALHDATSTVIRAVDWPLDYSPQEGSIQPIRAVTETEGAHVVSFPFVPFQSPTAGPSSTSTATLGPPPSATPTATGPTPTRTATPTGTLTPPTASATPIGTAQPTPTTPPVLVVNSTADPGTVGDLDLTLDEAMRLVTGRLALGAMSVAERQQVTGEPGAASHDIIRFAPGIFPPESGATITIQPPTPAPPLVLMRPNQDLSAIERNSGLPELSTGATRSTAWGRRSTWKGASAPIHSTASWSHPTTTPCSACASRGSTPGWW